MPEDSREDCIRKLDLKTEAQRTNRFNNTNTFENSTSSFLSPCNRVENINGINDGYETHEKDDVPCINIILKPISDSQTDQRDKGIQIVEITAVTEDGNKYSIDRDNTSPKKTGKIESKSVQVQIKVEQSLHDSSTQIKETPTIQKCVSISPIKRMTPEITSGHFTPGQQPPDADINTQNKGVQFRDNKIVITDNVSCSNRIVSTGIDPRTKFLAKDKSLRSRDTTENIETDDTRKTDHKTSISPIECSDSRETSCKSINRNNKLEKPLELKSCVKKNGPEGQGKLSDRIKCNIVQLEVGNSSVSTQSLATNTSRRESQRESITTGAQTSACTDICRDIIASRTELFETNWNKSGNSSAMQDTSTLASVLSNNPPIPRFSIDTTETAELESTPKDKSSEVTIDKTIADSSFSTDRDFSPCCSNKRLSLNGISNSENTDEKKFTRGFWGNDISSLSKLGIAKNCSVETKSTNTSNGMDKTLESISRGLPLINNDKLEEKDPLNPTKCFESAGIKSNAISFSQTPKFSASVDPKFGAKKDFALPKENSRSFLRASDLTRPEFIRMLTEIKEHTCCLELQLASMNEAMKCKQATRIKVLSSTPKNYESEWQDLSYKTQNEKLETTNESSCCGSDSSSIECATRFPEKFNIENGTCCGVNASSDPNGSYTPPKLPKKLKTSSRIVHAANPEQIIVVPDEFNISISKHRPKKAAFKTKRNHFWRPGRESDYRMWKHKLHSAISSVKSIILPEILSRSVSPNLSMIESEIDDSCSPTNCCDVPEDSSQTMFTAGGLSSISRIEESVAAARSANYSTTSNSPIHQMTVKPAPMTSTFKKNGKSSPNSEFEVVKQAGGNNDQHLELESSNCKAIGTTVASSCSVGTSNCSNVGKKSPLSTKVETILGVTKHSEKYATPVSLFKLKRPKTKRRLGVKQSSFKSRTKNRPESIPSNSHIPSSLSRESVDESQLNVPSESYKTEQNAKQEVLAKLLDRKLGKDQFTYSIMSKQNTPFSVNNLSRFDSEEEMSSMDYGCNKSRRDYCAKKSKDDVNGKKRKTNSGGEKFCKINEKPGLSNPKASKVQNSYNNSQLFQNRKDNGYTLRNTTQSQSVHHNQYSKKVQGLDNASEKSNQNDNSHDRDSRCTVRVTVSLDDTLSNEEVKKSSKS